MGRILFQEKRKKKGMLFFQKLSKEEFCQKMNNDAFLDVKVLKIKVFPPPGTNDEG